MINSKPILAVDCDGVLLNYNLAYGQAYEEHFGTKLSVKDPLAFHATNYWGIEEPPVNSSFWQAFNEELDMWTRMPAIPGAVEACHEFVAMGFELVCVTSMPEKMAEKRQWNLQDLNFPIERVIACGRKHQENDFVPQEQSSKNPKKEAIEKLCPAWFVDDEWRKLKGFEGINLVMIDPGYSENLNQDATHQELRCVVPNLKSLADWFKLNPEFQPNFKNQLHFRN